MREVRRPPEAGSGLGGRLMRQTQRCARRGGASACERRCGQEQEERRIRQGGLVKGRGMEDKMDGVQGGWCAAGGGSALVNVCQGEDKREFSGGQVLLVTIRKAEGKRLRHAQQGERGERGSSAETARAAGEWPCADHCVRAEGAALVKEEGVARKQEHGWPDGRGGLGSALEKDEKKEGNQQDAEPCLRAGRPRGRKRRSRSKARPATLRCP